MGRREARRLLREVKARVRHRTFVQDVTNPETGQLDRQKLAAKFNNLEHAVDELAEAVEHSLDQTA